MSKHIYQGHEYTFVSSPTGQHHYVTDNYGAKIVWAYTPDSNLHKADIEVSGVVVSIPAYVGDLEGFKAYAIQEYVRLQKEFEDVKTTAWVYGSLESQTVKIVGTKAKT